VSFKTGRQKTERLKILRNAYFWVIKEREGVNFLPTFRVNLSGAHLQRSMTLE